jgi:hypothetical protein
MQKKLRIERRMEQSTAKALIEMMMKWEVVPTFQLQRRDDGTVDMLMSERTYKRAMAELAELRKAGRI